MLETRTIYLVTGTGLVGKVLPYDVRLISSNMDVFVYLAQYIYHFVRMGCITKKYSVLVV